MHMSRKDGQERGNGLFSRANPYMFEKDDDYAAFERVLEEAHAREDLRILSYSVIPNQWHMVVWPKQGADKQVSEFFHWLTVTHARTTQDSLPTVG